MKKTLAMLFGFLAPLFPMVAMASAAAHERMDLTSHMGGYLALLIFVVAYTLVIREEGLHLAKSKPVLMAAGFIWIIIAIIYQQHGIDHAAEVALRHNFLEFAELFFFLLVAMTYINAMIERGVFNALRIWLVGKGFSYRQIFLITGVLAFFLSPVADNLTTALIMGTVVLTVGKEQPKFIVLSCISIVVGANAGGAFSPFGDITTLMVWQKGIIDFTDFFKLFVPSVVNYALPAAVMFFFVPTGSPAAVEHQGQVMERGSFIVVALFLLTIVTAVCFHNFLHLPPAVGMMMGLAYLKIFAHYLKETHKSRAETLAIQFEHGESDVRSIQRKRGFDIFDKIAGAEWDTLFFFYGVIMAVGGLGFMGYLGLVSGFMYGELGATNANILVGVLSAIVDNIPVMFAVLTMNPEMSELQWLLVTLTAGVGGSLLSVGSAAGVALMGQARGYYTFGAHLKWAPVIAIGYLASIYVHFLVNG